MAATTAESPVFSEPEAPAGTEPPPLILIIDDSPDCIRTLSALIRDKGRVLFATEGLGGLALARQRRPDLILLDVEMPGLSGYEVCRQLKDDSSTRDIAVMFVTAHHSSFHEVAALEAGAVDFLTKPLAPAVVRARVQTQLTLKRQADALHRQAVQDGLTGVYNRRYFNEHLELEWRRHLRQRMPLGFALADIDHFKGFNDCHGHLEGDACLQQVAQALADSLRRPGEFVVRYGGEEFAVVMPHSGLADVQRFGERICCRVRELQRPHPASPTAGHVTLSVGVASLIPQPEMDSKALIALADRALYQAKQAGRNGVVVASG